MKLGEMLLEAGLVTEAQIEDAMSHDERRLGSALIAAGVVEAEVVARTLAQQHGLPAISLSMLSQRPAALHAILPEVLARRHAAVAIALRGAGKSRVLTVAMRDPSDLVAVDELTFAAGMKIEPRVAPEVSLRAALEAPAPGPVSVPVSAPVPVPVSAPVSAPAPLALSAGIPLTFPPSTGSRMVSSVIKIGMPLLILIGLIYLATAYKRCITSSTRAVGTHHDSRSLRLGIDFPESGWRIAPGAGKKVDAKAEYYYRGGIPELPHVGMFVLRGPAAEIAGAAEVLAGEVVQDVRSLECRRSYARADAHMCRGWGAAGLFGQPMMNAEVEVHTWRGTSDTIMVVMIKPDHTLSETELILGSIVEQ